MLRLLLCYGKPYGGQNQSTRMYRGRSGMGEQECVYTSIKDLEIGADLPELSRDLGNTGSDFQSSETLETTDLEKTH